MSKAPSRSRRRSAARLAAVQALYQRQMEGTPLARLLDEFHQHRLGQEIEDAQYVSAEVEFFDDVVSGVVAREEERSRLRRDVHDGLGPALAAVKVRIDAARNVAASDPAQADRILEVASRTVTDAVADIRRIVHDLRPPTLDDLGLRTALERVCDSWEDTGPVVTLDYALEATPPPAIEVAVYRIASEAINNARRHSGARHVRVGVSESEQSVVVEIADDGGGIPRNAAPGVGLRSMRERAAELGGELAISSGRAGTTIRAVIPRRPPAKEAARV